MATIKDVAQLAEVSVATVSNYLNKTKPVSRKVATRIAKAIDQLQYTQNLAAKSLKTNLYSSVGVILPNLTDSYYLQIFQGIEERLKSSGLFLNLAFSYDVPELEIQEARRMLQKQVSGLIVVTCQPANSGFYLGNFIKKNKGLVLIDRSIHGINANTVSFDNFNTVLTITEELLNIGYSKLALMAGPGKYSCEQNCVDGFLKAFSPEQTSFATVINTALNKESAFRKTTRLLNNKQVNGIITTSELSAAGIIEALHVLGYVNNEIPVITLGEEHWNKHTHSFASFSVERPAILIGKKSANILIEQLADKEQQIQNIVLGVDTEDLRKQIRQYFSKSTNTVSSKSVRKIRVLMLDIPTTRAICSILKNFENATGITAEVTLLSHSSLYEAILNSECTSIPDEKFDVYMYDLPWLPALSSQGVLQDISRLLSDIPKEAFLPGSLEDFGMFEGRYYGMPLMYAPQVLYYQKELFDDHILLEKFEKIYGIKFCPPRSFAEYNMLAKFFTQETEQISYGISIPAAYAECLAPELYMRLRAFGSEVISQDGEVVINNAKARRAYRNLLESIEYAKLDFRNTNDVNAVEDFLAGETAMLISYPGFLTDVTDLRKNNYIGSIGCSQIPGRSPLLGGWSLGISRHCETTEDAFSFLSWACTEKMNNYFSMLGSYSAVSSTYANDELVQLYPWRPLYKKVYSGAGQMLPCIKKGNVIVSPNDIDTIVCKGLFDIIDNGKEIDEVIADTEAQLKSLLLD